MILKRWRCIPIMALGNCSHFPRFFFINFFLLKLCLINTPWPLSSKVQTLGRSAWSSSMISFFFFKAQFWAGRNIKFHAVATISIFNFFFFPLLILLVTRILSPHSPIFDPFLNSKPQGGVSWVYFFSDGRDQCNLIGIGRPLRNLSSHKISGKINGYFFFNFSNRSNKVLSIINIKQTKRDQIREVRCWRLHTHEAEC